MDRKEFLSQLGFGAAGVLFMGCLGGCKKDVPAAPSNVNLSIDLTNSTYSALNTSGGYMYLGNGIILARTLTDNYIAVSQYCTHEGVSVIYESDNSTFYCSAHGSVFNANGAVTNGPAGSPLKQYTVTKTGNIITIKG